MASARIVQFTSRNVYTNLAGEERFFRATSGRSLLFYVNSECVVLGRTQNPLKEVDVRYAIKQGIPIARRKSGGGTVVHDEGNLNFCFTRPRAEHDPISNVKLIASVLRDEFGIRAVTNERADILVDGMKVSGAAYRISGNRAYHHGTLLINSNLDRLRRVLRSPMSAHIDAMGTKSLSSPVTNLCEHSSTALSTACIIEAIAERFARHSPVNIGLYSASNIEREFGALQRERGELCSFKWIYGQIPRFSYALNLGDIEVKFEMAKGLVVSNIEIHKVGESGMKDVTDIIVSDTCKLLLEILRGKLFDASIVCAALNAYEGDALIERISKGIREEVAPRFVEEAQRGEELDT